MGRSGVEGAGRGCVFFQRGYRRGVYILRGEVWYQMGRGGVFIKRGEGSSVERGGCMCSSREGISSYVGLA